MYTTEEKRLALQAYFIANPDGGLELSDTDTDLFDIDELRRTTGKKVEDLQVTHLTAEGFLSRYIDKYGDVTEDDVTVSFEEAPESAIEQGYEAFLVELALGADSVALNPTLWRA